ncbi:MAG: cysteine--tRNA ligase, partial [Clostridia bacterium]
IAKFYTDAFFSDCKELNIKIPETVVPATSCVDEFIKMISVLLEKGYAYIMGGNVYFDTSKPNEYYVFNKHDAEDLEVGVRDGVEEDKNKKNKSDFVLWFTKSKFEDQELKWESPWGVGYPGWHIECSAISLKYLGENLDIHCGGIDNAFPHHTNEIAQSEAYLGHKWCNFWFHVFHLNTNDGKMSKSKGEFLTISLLKEKGYDPLIYRFFCLQSHYRKVLVFSYDALDNAAIAYNKLIAKIATLDFDSSTEPDTQAVILCKKNFSEALDNDINTSLAITSIYDVLKYDTDDATKIFLIEKFDAVLGLDLIEKAKSIKNFDKNPTFESDNAIDALLKARSDAKANKDYKTADEIRNKLKEMGISIEDTPQGPKWKKM